MRINPSGIAEFQQGNDSFLSVSTKPTPAQLNALCERLQPGKNLLEFQLISFQTKLIVSCSTLAAIWFWQPGVRVCVFDIDGTITKSDSMGILSTIINYEREGKDIAAVIKMTGFLKDYIHEGVIEALNSISSHLNLLYLTARPITHEKILRSFLQEKKAPIGALVTMACPTFISLTKSHQPFKTELLASVKRLFPAGEEPRLAMGFGNQQSDVEAYHNAGIPAERIFLIDKESIITVPRGRGHFKCKSYSALKPHLDAICTNQEPLSIAPDSQHLPFGFGEDCLAGLASVWACCSPRSNPKSKHKFNSADTVRLHEHSQ